MISNTSIMKRFHHFLPLLATGLILFLGSCSKNDNAAINGSDPDPSGNGGNNGGLPRPTLNIRLTDAPASLDSVVVDIREVRVLFSSDSTDTTYSDSSWIIMNTNAGLYDLLSFQNGIDTLLASAPVPNDTVHQVRFILGDNNYVVENGTQYPMFVPSGAQSGLKVNLARAMNNTLQTITIDFDAAASIRKVGSNYMLRPVLIVR